MFMKTNILSRTIYAGLLLALSVTAAHAQGIITTIAGTGASGLSGDGGPATAATFATPAGVAVDATGNVYIADRYNGRIRMISASTGNISTVAGTSVTYAMTGMGGPATAAEIIYPNALTIDAAGNYYASDWWADAAYKVDISTNYITNICGHHVQGCTGDGGDGPMATIAIPGGISLDNAGNVYIADYGNNRIRKLNAATNIVTTIAGGISGPALNGVPAITAGFGQINGVCVDHLGDIYISDAGNHCVRKIDHMGLIRTIAGNGTPGYTGDGGSSLEAELNNPGCLFINASGDLFICDDVSNVVRVMNVSSGIIHTLAGTGAMGFSGDGGAATSATLNQPTGVWQDAAGIIYIADAGNNRIRRITGSAYKTTGATKLTENNAHIFPNPSTGTITIQTSSVPDNGSFDVYNVVGEKVYAGTISEQQTTISINQPAGVYTIVLKTATGSTTEKVTIAR